MGRCLPLQLAFCTRKSAEITKPAQLASLRSESHSTHFFQGAEGVQKHTEYVEEDCKDHEDTLGDHGVDALVRS